MLGLLRLSLWLVFAAEFWIFVGGQTNHTVLMGVAGSFFDPAVLSAELGDTVTFVFGNGVHGATQSSFETPCVPLEGGFNSGLVSALNYSQPIESWNLIITNISAPIWYFCQATRPQSHCAAGMVGAINPPSIEMFNEFVSAAKAVSGTPSPSIGVTLTGIGAYATSPPSATPGAPTPSPPPSSSSTTSAPPSSTSSASPSHKKSSSPKAGMIAGAVLGSVIAVTIITVLIILLRRAHLRLQQRQYIDTSSVYRDPVLSPDQNHHAFAAVPLPHRTLSGHQYATLRPLPVSPGQDLPDVSSPPPQQMSQAYMHALAKEVASLIRSPYAGDPSVTRSSLADESPRKAPGLTYGA